MLKDFKISRWFENFEIYKDLHGEPLNCDGDGRSSFFHSNPSTFRQPLQELLWRYGAENLQVK